MIYVKAFVVGGIICTLVQIFLDHTKLMPGRVMVLLVITGVILGATGIYETLIKMGRMRSKCSAVRIWI